MSTPLPYYVHDLSPFVFEVQNIDLSVLMHPLTIVLLFLVYGVGSLIAYCSSLAANGKPLPKAFHFLSPVLFRNQQKLSFVISTLFYTALFGSVMIGLKVFGIHWGLRWYSMMYLTGFLIVHFTCLHWIKKKKIMLTESLLVTFISYCIIGMLLGARLAFVFIYDWNSYKDNLWKIIATWEGGLSFHGGIFGVCLAIFLFCRKYNLRFYHLTDKMGLLVPLGIACGRIGNFINGELWGRPIKSDVPWAVIFPDGGMIPRHPSQIYQCLGEGIGLFLTIFILTRRYYREGVITWATMFFYSLYRFFVEYFRAADEQLNYYSLVDMQWLPLPELGSTWFYVTMGQLLCVGLALFSLIMLFTTRNNIIEGSKEWLADVEAFFRKHDKKDAK